MDNFYANRSISMQIEVTHDYGYRVRYIECMVEENGEEYKVWERSYACRGGYHGMVCEGETPLTETFLITRSFGLGLHEIRVIAYDEFGNSGSSSIVVNLTEPPPPPQPAPSVTPSLNVLRRDNYFFGHANNR